MEGHEKHQHVLVFPKQLGCCHSHAGMVQSLVLW